MVAPTPFFAHRGCHIRIAEEVKFLVKKGYKVKIVTYHVGEDLVGFDIERIPYFFWYKRLASGASWHKLYLDFFLLLKTFFVLLSFRPDILHCHLHEGGFIGIILRPFFRGRIIFDSQSSLVEELSSDGYFNKYSFRFQLLLKVEQLIYRYSEVILASNKYYYQELVRHFLIPKSKIYLIPDGIDKKGIKVDPARVTDLREKVRLPKRKKIIMYLGGLSKTHGINSMILLASILFKMRKDVVWVLGGYPNEDLYRNLIEKKRLSHIMHIYGPVRIDDIFNFLSIGAFGISLKLFTTQGNLKLLHYALAGLQIICYDVPSNRAIIGNSALYLSSGKSDLVHAKEISNFLDIPEKLRLRRSKKLRDYVLKQFDWEKVLIPLEEIYHGKT